MYNSNGKPWSVQYHNDHKLTKNGEYFNHLCKHVCNAVKNVWQYDF